MEPQVNLREILAKIPEQMTKEELTAIINAIYTQNPALGSPHPKCETDDEYLPTCCRNGNSHSHPV
jgi:hypothetical protein